MFVTPIRQAIRRLWTDRLRSWYRASLREDSWLALRIALIYLLFGVLWVTLSDRLLAAFVDGAARLSSLQTLKGWAFVIVTATFVYLVTWITIRARSRMRRRKRESERFLRTLIGNLPGVVYACKLDDDWTMTYLSPGVERLTGHRPDVLLGEGPPTFGSLIHEADREAVERQVSAAVERRGVFELEYRLRTRSGEIRWVRERGRGVFRHDGSLHRLEGFIIDVTARHRANERLQRQVQRLRALRAIDLAIMGSLDLRITLDVVLDQVTTQLEVDAAAVFTYRDGPEQLEGVAGRGFSNDTFRGARLRLGEGPAGRAAMTRETVRIADLSSDPQCSDLPWLSSEENFVSYFAVPLVAQGRLVGVLELLHRSRLDPDDDWLEFRDTLAGQTAIAIDRAKLIERLERANTELRLAYDQTIEGWARALDLRDHETEGHSRRVMDLALVLAERMDVQPERLVHLRRGALLHDIGKLGIPDSVLLKPGPLDEEERTLMNRHPEYAVDLLSPIPFLRDALDIPYYHHERWDGDGHPRGLAGEAIPLPARIFAVVDVWDALRSDRPYRTAWSGEEARDYIREQAGSHFDPEVVDAFLAMDREVIERIEVRSRPMAAA